MTTIEQATLHRPILLVDDEPNILRALGYVLSKEGFRVETTPKNTVELILSNGSTLIVSPDTLLEVKTFRQVVSDRIIDGEYQKLEKEPSPSITEIEVIRGKVIEWRLKVVK